MISEQTKEYFELGKRNDVHKFIRFTKRIYNIGGIVCRSRMVRGFDILKSNIKSKFKQNGGK